jgi:oligopeptide/dipeptide ABC transporter ATP-binding protein
MAEEQPPVLEVRDLRTGFKLRHRSVAAVDGVSFEVRHGERVSHPYTRGLIDAIPLPDPELARSRTRIAVSGELPSAINPPSGCRFRSHCPLVQDIGAQEEPPLRIFGTGHRAACHFPLRPPVESVANSAEPTHAEDWTTGRAGAGSVSTKAGRSRARLATRGLFVWAP